MNSFQPENNLKIIGFPSTELHNIHNIGHFLIDILFHKSQTLKKRQTLTNQLNETVSNENIGWRSTELHEKHMIEFLCNTIYNTLFFISFLFFLLMPIFVALSSV